MRPQHPCHVHLAIAATARKPTAPLLEHATSSNRHTIAHMPSIIKSFADIRALFQNQGGTLSATNTKPDLCRPIARLAFVDIYPPYQPQKKVEFSGQSRSSTPLHACMIGIISQCRIPSNCRLGVNLHFDSTPERVPSRLTRSVTLQCKIHRLADAHRPSIFCAMISLQVFQPSFRNPEQQSVPSQSRHSSCRRNDNATQHVEKVGHLGL